MSNLKISDILKRERTLSFEVFPPKIGGDFDGIAAASEKIAALVPDFMSVTYGAGGSTGKTTVWLADNIQNRYGVPVLAHMTCYTLSRLEVDEFLTTCDALGIKNIMALRGDAPESGEVRTDFAHASDLISYIKSRVDYCVGAACYPECHPNSLRVTDDIESLKIKVDSGCDFLTTQMFFDNNIFYNFMYRLLKIGVDVPVLPGIMPVTNEKQMKRIIALSGTEVPMRFRHILDMFGHSPECMAQAGIAYATEQIIDLYANGVNNVHVYSMNKPAVAQAIKKNLGSIIA